MKQILTTSAFIILFISANAQACKIKLTSDDGKQIVFLIKLDGTNIEMKSNNLGELVVADSVKTKYGNNDISFRYHHNLDNEYYRTPQLVRKNHTLNEICGQVLMAERRD